MGLSGPLIVEKDALNTKTKTLQKKNRFRDQVDFLVYSAIQILDFEADL